MKKTFYAIEMEVWEITADVDAHDVTIDSRRHPPKRTSLRTLYRGDFTKDRALMLLEEVQKAKAALPSPSTRAQE